MERNSKHIVRLLLLALSFFIVQSRTAAQSNYEIRKITFSGNDSVKSERLQNTLSIKTPNWFEKKFSKKEASRYDEQLIEIETERLTRLYQREGFLESKITPRLQNIDEKRTRLDIEFQIEEGSSFHVDSVRIQVNGQTTGFNTDSLFRAVSKKFEIKKGSRFSDDALGADVSAIRSAFQRNGYFYAEASYQLQLYPTQHLVSVEYAVKPGPKNYFGETTLEGNKHVSSEFIRKQLDWHEGDVFSTAKLDETRKNMFKLQLFSVLSVQPQTDSIHQSKIPVKLVINEAKRFDSKFGVGYGTEDKFRAYTEMTYKGFLGGARRLNLKIKHSALTPYDFNLNWIQPQFLNKKLSAAVNPFISRVKEPGYELREMGANLKLSYTITDQLTLNGSYYYDRVKQLIDPSDSLLFDDSDLPYNKSGIILSTVFDNTSPKFSPKKGFNVLLAWKLNGYVFGGDYNFNRLWADVRYFQQLGKIVLANRLMLGTILENKNSYYIPSEERFFAGGSNSVRGWERSMLGPLIDESTPLGGASVAQGSFEFRIPVIGKFSLVSFLDYGNVWLDNLAYKLKDLAYATGGGIRFDTPIGPIRFDVGVPIWNEKRSAEVFISVGQAF